MADWRNRIVGLEYHKPGEIADHPLQWRVHSTAQEAALRAVLSEVGIAGALLAYRNNGGLVAIDGHLRKSLDADAEWPVLLLDVTEDEANKLLATTDPLAAMAGADAAMLGDLLAVIETENDTLQALLDGLAEEHGIVTEEPPDDPGAQIDKAEELREKWGVSLGDVWEIGDHRLVCGDCTDAAVVDAVMRGERARVVATSPPYADQREYGLGEFDWLVLANGMFDALPLGDPCDILVNLGLSYKDGKANQYWQPWLDGCEQKGHALYGWYVWDKGRGFPGEWNGRLAPSHEFIFHFSIGHVSANKWVEKAASSFERLKYSKTTMQRGQDGEWRPPTSMQAMRQTHKIPDSVLRVWPDTQGVGDHPAIFPVEFAEFLVSTWGEPAALVYDPFLGSGTTLVACERLGRRGRGIELSPGYCAVSIQRLADMGLEPRLADG